MDTQRDLDGMSYTNDLAVEAGTAKALSAVKNAFASESSVLLAIEESQIAFEAYRESQLKLVSAINTGTVAALVRNKGNQLLFEQRAEFLRVLLLDNAPDRML